MGATAPLGREPTRTVAIARPSRVKPRRPTFVRAGTPKRAAKPAKPAAKPKPAARAMKPAPKSTKPAARSTKPAPKTAKTAARANRPAAKARKPATAPATPPMRAAAHRIRATKHRVRSAAAAATVAARPHLRLVARPRFAVNAALVLAGVIVALMLATVVLHTRLAERQVEIDRLEAAVTEARERFDVLRRQRAELRSPTRLAAAAGELGMAEAPQTAFLTVDPTAVAEVLASAGPILGDDVEGDDHVEVDLLDEPLDQIRRVKAAGGPP